MTDDDRFVTAVVAAPADAVLRGVYADWLDDHADPRGPYLRAELDWAATRPADGVAAVRALAAGLDPVWAARVGRPPVGVCVEALKATGPTGLPRLTAADLDWAEGRFAVTLPADYRAFLPNTIAGPTPELHVMALHEVPKLGEPDFDPAAVELDWNTDLIYCLRYLEQLRTDPAGMDPYHQNLAHLYTTHARDVMWVGYVGPNGEFETVGLAVRGAAVGRVVLVNDRDYDPDSPAEWVIPAAPTFADFLADIEKPPAGRAASA